MKRRSYLARSAALGGAALGGTALAPFGRSSGGGDRSIDPDADRPDRERYSIMTGTERETDVYVIDGRRDGPTALVVGGMHGDEECGFLAAEDVATWRFDAGTVVVLPRANRLAIERARRTAADGVDLNRQFPTGEEPTTALAREIWGVVERHDPDVALDLHRSKGIYRVHAGFVGQTVFPTDAGGAPGRAADAVESVNGSVVPWYLPLHAYRRGGSLTGRAPMLIHKVAGDLNRAGYLVETTDFMLARRTRVRWQRAVAERLLADHGLARRGEGGA